MVRLTQQQLPSSAARDNGCMPLANVLRMVGPLLCCWAEMIECKPALLQVVVRTLLPLVQQLQGCGSLLMRPAAAAAAASVQGGSSSGSSSSSSYEHKLQYQLFVAQQAASRLLTVIYQHKQVDAGVAAELLRLHNDPAVAEMQLQLLTAWTAELHTAQQQQQQQQQQLPPGTAGVSSSSSSMQGQQQPVRQERRADLLPIPAFHQDMLQLLPGGYLDVAAETAARWGEDSAFQLRTHASNCCNTINRCLESHRESIAGQQQISRMQLVLSAAAVRLVLELQLLASGAVQKQREQLRQQHQEQQQQQQQQQVSPPEDQASTDRFALQTFDLLGLQIKALAATSCSCLPPELLQQAGLQLLQALAAPLQLWQLSRPGDSFVATADVTGASPLFGDTLPGLVTAACGAQATQSQDMIGEQYQWSSGVCKSAF
jgi:hypothetical protein